MDAEIAKVNTGSHILNRALYSVVPVLLISVGYVDPGKWAAAVDGGARFGFDLLALVFIFNLAAVCCQYFSARIGVVTGKGLAEICSDEYDAGTCIFLGIQTELSMIALDLTMVLGIAHGINLLFGVDLFTCIILTAVDVVLFPVFASHLEEFRGKFICICIAGFILLSYIFGVLWSQPYITLSSNWVLTKLDVDGIFALLSLLGANIMPHNFYIHSSLVQKNEGPPNLLSGSMYHDHFFAIFGVFSSINLVHYVLMISAATVFNSTGVILLTFQDAMSLMEQVLRSPISTVFFLLILYLSNQITALTWCICGKLPMHDLLKLDVPASLHRATVRVLAVLASIFCVWNSGGEGMYQLLIFTQVVVALLLPSAVIPLFRVAASRPIMGVYKISQTEEYLTFAIFIGMLGLKLKFLLDLIFGNCDWVDNLRWNTGTNASAPHGVLLVTSGFCLFLMIWLLATPLKSASVADDQTLKWRIRDTMPRSFTDKVCDMNESRCHAGGLVGDQDGSLYDEEISAEKQDVLPSIEKSMESFLDAPHAKSDGHLHETVTESEQELHLAPVVKSFADISPVTSQVHHPDESTSMQKANSKADFTNDVSDVRMPESPSLKVESSDSVERTCGTGGGIESDKEDDMDSWESFKGVSTSGLSLTSEGPGSLRSLSGKSDESGNVAGSLSRLAGLGRSARRQLTAVLDEFWGQLYDYHGQVIPEAKAKKLDALLGTYLNHTSTSSKVDITREEGSGNLSSLGGRELDPVDVGFYGNPKQQIFQSGSLGTQRVSSSSWSSHMPFLHNSSKNVIDNGERRYSSLRLPPHSNGWDYQNFNNNTVDSDERRYSSLHQLPASNGWGSSNNVIGSGERRYSSLRLPLACDGLGYQNFSNSAIESDERRYSSLRLPLASNGLDYQNYSNNAIDSSERRYSSLHIPPTSIGGLDYQNSSNSIIDSGEKRYSSLRLPPDSNGWGFRNSSTGVIDSGERRYSSLRLPPASNVSDYEPASLHDYQIAMYCVAKEASPDISNGQMKSLLPRSPSLGKTNFRNSIAFALSQKQQNGIGSGLVPGFQSSVISRDNSSQCGRIYNDACSPGTIGNAGSTPDLRKYNSSPDISGRAVRHGDLQMSGRSGQWGGRTGLRSSAGRLSYDTSLYSNTASRLQTPLTFDELSPKVYEDALSLQMTSGMETASLWSRQPSEQLGVAYKNCSDGSKGFGSRQNVVGQKPACTMDSEAKLLQSVRDCIIKLLKLEGSDWLFRQQDGLDEDLIDRVAAREKFLYEAEFKEIKQVIQMAEPHRSSSDRSGSALESDSTVLSNLLVTSIPHCGDGCIWKADLVISFGVWCIHRILDLSLMESRPELWGKYTYVLNRLQGIIEPAFFQARTPMIPCFCLQIPTAQQQRSNSSITNGILPPTAKPAKGKFTTAETILDLIKDVDIAISCRKGRSGTAAGDVAFPKGKGNLTSVLKRYKRRLSKKPGGINE